MMSARPLVRPSGVRLHRSSVKIVQKPMLCLFVLGVSLQKKRYVFD